MAVAAIKAQQGGGFKRQLDLTVSRQYTMPEDDILKAGELGRQTISVSGVTWPARSVVLTSNAIYFGRPGTKKVLDVVPLLEIQSVEPVGVVLKGAAKADADDDGPGGEDCCFCINPNEDAESFSGRALVLQAKTPGERAEWLSVLSADVKRAKEAVKGKKDLLTRCRHKVYKIYHSHQAQCFVGLVIMASYATAIAASQMLPEKGSAEANTFYILEVVFTIIFAAELLVNAFGSWFWDFITDGWSVFDAIVVAISIAGLIQTSLPAVNVLRLVRVFKMVRLFQQLQSLRILINALTRSIIPVMNAFAILLLVSSIYAVVATDLFSVDADNFGNFFRSLYTLFQVASGDSWSSVVTRGLMARQEDAVQEGLIALFFVSYVLIVGIVLMNIVVAVLLDEFITTVEREKQDKAHAEELKAMEDRVSHAPLDPVIETLINFVTVEDLKTKIADLYERFDPDESGTVDLDEINHGLRKLPLPRPVRLSPEDYEEITEYGRWTSADGELTANNFEGMIMTQLRRYTRRKMVEAMAKNQSDQDYDQMFALKMIIANIDYLRLAIAPEQNLSSKTKLFSKSNIGLKDAFEAWKDCVGRCDTDDELALEEEYNVLDEKYGHEVPERIGFEAFAAAPCHKDLMQNEIWEAFEKLSKNHGDSAMSREDFLWHWANLEHRSAKPIGRPHVVQSKDERREFASKRDDSYHSKIKHAPRGSQGEGLDAWSSSKNAEEATIGIARLLADMEARTTELVSPLTRAHAELKEAVSDLKTQQNQVLRGFAVMTASINSLRNVVHGQHTTGSPPPTQDALTEFLAQEERVGRQRTALTEFLAGEEPDRGTPEAQDPRASVPRRELTPTGLQEGRRQSDATARAERAAALAPEMLSWRAPAAMAPNQEGVRVISRHSEGQKGLGESDEATPRKEDGLVSVGGLVLSSRDFLTQDKETDRGQDKNGTRQSDRRRQPVDAEAGPGKAKVAVEEGTPLQQRTSGQAQKSPHLSLPLSNIKSAEETRGSPGSIPGIEWEGASGQRGRVPRSGGLMRAKYLGHDVQGRERIEERVFGNDDFHVQAGLGLLTPNGYHQGEEETETERHHLERERALLEAKGKLRSTGLAHNEHGTWTVMRKQRREVGGGEGSPLPSPPPPMFQPPVFAAAFASTGRDGELRGEDMSSVSVTFEEVDESSEMTQIGVM